jgi:hypothetical protein
MSQIQFTFSSRIGSPAKTGCPKKAPQFIYPFTSLSAAVLLAMDTQNERFSFPFTKIRGRRRSNTPSWIFADHMIANFFI